MTDGVMSFLLLCIRRKLLVAGSVGVMENYDRKGVSMEERFQMIENYLMIRMPEEIDHHQASILSEGADEYIMKEPVRNIVFDFEDTRFMDSSGIGIIAGRYKKIACFGGMVYAVNVNSRILKMIQLSGLKKVLKVME